MLYQKDPGADSRDFLGWESLSSPLEELEKVTWEREVRFASHEYATVIYRLCVLLLS